MKSPTPMNELERLVDYANRIEYLLREMIDLDPLEYERVQSYISSKYKVDLPLNQPE